MKNIERIMARDAMSQLMADAGINQNTLVDLIKELLNEKVDKAVKRCLENYSLDALVEARVKAQLQNEIAPVIKRMVQQELRFIDVRVAIVPFDKSK